MTPRIMRLQKQRDAMRQMILSAQHSHTEYRHLYGRQFDLTTAQLKAQINAERRLRKAS